MYVSQNRLNVDLMTARDVKGTARRGEGFFNEKKRKSGKTFISLKYMNCQLVISPVEGIRINKSPACKIL